MLNLSMCAESSTDTDMGKKQGRKKIYISSVRCHMPRFMCCMSCVTCHLSAVNNGNSYRPYPYYLPHYAYQAGLQRSKKTHTKNAKEFIKTEKTQTHLEVCHYQLYSLRPKVFSQPGSSVFKCEQTDRQMEIMTYRLNRPRGAFSENLLL